MGARGATFVSRSRLSSAERRGGGGEGGFGVTIRGERGALRDGEGVCVRLGILKPLDDVEELLGVAGAAAASGFKNGDWSKVLKPVTPLFGGD